MTDLKPATSRAPTTGSPVRGRRPRHRPVKQSTIWVHRWLSLVLGLFLVLETSSGSIVLYRAEIDRHVHRADYAQGVDQDTVPTVSYQQAIDAVTEAHPKVTPTGAYSDDGTILVYDDTSTYSVDPRSGAVLGDWTYTEHPGAIAWTLTAAENIHFCFFSCKGDPLYLGFMAKTIPYTAWLGGFDADINVATLTLGILAILLVFLSLSGVWLWWPTIRHFKRGVRVRFKANRYARDYDLHQVVGMIAIPLLLMWGLTGMSLEYGWFAKAYYAAAPGSERTVDFTSAKVAEGTEGTEDIGYDAAVAAARAKVDTTQQPVYYSVPAADDATAVYDIWFSHGFDPWTGNGNSGGDLEVLVDRHDASRSDVGYGSPQESLAQHVFQDYNYTLHGGLIVHSWLRIVWLVLGLTPLLLMWTGISTWLFKRAVRARRRNAVRARTAAVDG